MRTKPRLLLVPLLLVLSSACATGVRHDDWGTAGRAAIDLPDAFTPEPPAQPRTCSGWMVDPRRDSRLKLQRSNLVGTKAIGDYHAEGRYGVQKGEYLRIDCGTGKAIGIVPTF